MFTRFSTPEPSESAPLAGALVSVVAHATVILLVVGGPSGTGGDETHGGRTATSAAAPASEPGRGVTERVQWVGAATGDTPWKPSRPGERPPVAYVIPGRGPLHLATGPVVPPHARAKRTESGAPIDVPRVEAPHRLPFFKMKLAPLPTPPEIDVSVLFAGVASSAPDLSRLVTHPEDFRRFRPAGEAADLLARANVLTPNGLLPVGPVDVLPVAFVSNPLPAYPMLLAHAHVGGHVVVEFTIDSAGVVDVASLEVVRSTNSLFEQAVRAVLPSLHFLPAQLGQHNVGVRVRQPFEFVVR
jgi:TonB family protein